jgi:hypothetical protein
MARKYNNFTYLNTDTMSIVSNLHHTISDTEGRASFSVVGFVPVYDPRIDSSADSPFLVKFGKEDPINKVYTKFPQSHRNSEAADNSPFTILSEKLGGILSTEDVYLWKPGSNTSQYSVEDSVTKGEFGESNYFVRLETGTSYNEDSLTGVISFSDESPETVTKVSGDFSATLENVQTGVARKHQFIGTQLLTGSPYRSVWGFTPTTPEDTEVAIARTSVLKDVPTWDALGNNLTVPTYDLDAGSGTWTDISKITVGTTLTRSPYIRSTQGPVYSKSKQVNYNQLIRIADNGSTEFDNITSDSQTLTSYSSTSAFPQDVFKNIRYFAKSATNEGELSKTMASYRIQLDDQVGTIMFNKVITYVRLYLKDENGDWGWSDRLYPLTVTIMPEPITKSNHGDAGMDSFELDIQIDYNQNGKTYSFTDTDRASKISNWIPIVNAAAPEPDVLNPIVPNSEDPYVGLQWDSKLILSKNVNPTATGKSTLVETTDGDVTKLVTSQSNNTGRITSENTSSLYKDIDLEDLETSIIYNGQTITIKGTDVTVTPI